MAAAPTVDTRGTVGLEGKLTFALGLTDMDHERKTGTTIGLLTTPVAASTGVRNTTRAEGEVGVDAGVEYARVGRSAGDLGGRAGLFYTHRYDGRSGVYDGGGIGVGAPWTFARGDGGSRLAFGPVLDALLLGTTGERLEGRFGAGVALDFYRLTTWTVR